MKQTPMHGNFNAELLALMPRNAKRLSKWGAAAAHWHVRTGVSIQPANMSVLSHPGLRRTRPVHNAPESSSATSKSYPTSPSSRCYLRTAGCSAMSSSISTIPGLSCGESASPCPLEGSVVACIPNAQHWSLQIRLNTGEFRYEDSGLLDRTHIRWFTNRTVGELFRSTGYEIVEGGGRVLEELHRDMGLGGVRALAASIGANVDEAVETPLRFNGWSVQFRQRK